jgi:hypothetical protein
MTDLKCPDRSGNDATKYRSGLIYQRACGTRGEIETVQTIIHLFLSMAPVGMHNEKLGSDFCRNLGGNGRQESLVYCCAWNTISNEFINNLINNMQVMNFYLE